MGEQKSFLSAVKWAYSLFWGEKGISAVLFFLLAGLLGPKDFGTVSIAATYVAFLQLFLDQGLAAALIQRRSLEQTHLDAAFWTNLAIGLGLVLTSFLFSHRWATFNHAPETASVIHVLSLSIVIEALSIVQTALLRRHMDFRLLAIRSNISILVGGIVGITMAFLGFGVWSLVCQQLLRDILALLLLWKMSPWRPSLSFSMPSLNELLSFSVPNFVAQLANFVDGQVGSIVLGALFGPFAVGLFKFAEKAVATIITLSSGSIHTVSFPQFSRLQDKHEELRNRVLTAVGLSASVSLPALAGLAAISNPLMATIGADWIPASDALKMLAAAGVASVFTNFTGPLIQALGRPIRGAVLEWGRTIAGLIALAGTGLLVRSDPMQDQVWSIATARFFTTWFLITPVFIYVLLDLSNVSLRSLLASAFPSALASIAVILSVGLFHHLGASEEYRPVVALVVEVAIGAVVGLAVLILSDRRISRFIGMMSQRVVRQLAPRAP